MPKRRSFLPVAITAVVILVGGLSLVDLRIGAKADPPRLVVLREEQRAGENVVVFRFDAPKYKSVILELISTQVLPTGEELKPKLYPDGYPRELRGRSGAKLYVNHQMRLKSGQRVEFEVAHPEAVAWRLRGRINVLATAVTDSFRVKIWRCWKTKSLTPFRQGLYRQGEYIVSEIITNAHLKSADVAPETAVLQDER